MQNNNGDVTTALPCHGRPCFTPLRFSALFFRSLFDDESDDTLVASMAAANCGGVAPTHRKRADQYGRGRRINAIRTRIKDLRDSKSEPQKDRNDQNSGPVTRRARSASAPQSDSDSQFIHSILDGWFRSELTTYLCTLRSCHNRYTVRLNGSDSGSRHTFALCVRQWIHSFNLSLNRPYLAPLRIRLIRHNVRGTCHLVLSLSRVPIYDVKLHQRPQNRASVPVGISMCNTCH